MKKLVAFILGMFCFFIASAQSSDSLEKKFLLNFVVPDMPAYKGLGIEKSDLLRPADIKDFAIMLSPF